MKLDEYVQRRADLITAEMDGGLVMMDVISGKYFHLTGVGNAIWEKTETSIKVSDLIENLICEYDVSRDICTKDTLDFLNELKERGLLAENQ